MTGMPPPTYSRTSSQETGTTKTTDLPVMTGAGVESGAGAGSATADVPISPVAAKS